MGVILFSLTSLMENRLLIEFHANATRDHYISTTFLSIALFILFLSINQVKTNTLSTLGEKDSLYIYLFHPLFMTFFSIVNKYLGNLWQETYSYLAPLIILVTAITLSESLRNLHIIK